MGLLMRRKADRSDKLGMARARSRHSNRLALVLSLVFGALATVTSFVYLSSQRDSGPAAVAAEVVTTPMVVAAEDIPARTELTAGMLRVEQVPADLLHPQGYESIEPIVGYVTKYPLTAGEPLLQPKLADASAGLGLTSLIPADKRAVSIEVNDVSASAGLINPGDMVDVLAAFEVERAGVNRTVTVLQNVTVLAVARSLQPDAEADEGEPLTNGRSTVTLALTPEEAERLLMADVKGIIRLALRPVTETPVMPLPGVDLDDITGQLPADGGG